MNTRVVFRLLVVSLTFAFIFAGANHFSANAANRTEWTARSNIEDAVVQSCDGFDVTGNYTADRAFQVVEDYSGHTVYQRLDVSFSGAVGSDVSGDSFAFDGAFTRIGNSALEQGAISNLSLQFGEGTANEFAVVINRVDFPLRDDPHAIVKALALSVLREDLCALLGGPATSLPVINVVNVVHTENSVAEQRVAPYDERSVSNPSVNGQSETTALPRQTDTCTVRPRPGVPSPC